MTGSGNSPRGVRLLIGCLPLLLLAGSVRAEPPGSAPEMLQDAALCDVYFADADLGWAVGDRGVIWHTRDGGRHWQLLDSPVTCRLESIHFVDSQHGWIVGGWSHAFTHRTSGVVLHSSDGGRRWSLLAEGVLPRLKTVKFFDRRHGWAAGHATALYPNGVFRSDDGGRSWSAVPGGARRGCLTADFRDLHNGVLAGRDGMLALVVNTQLKPSPTPGLGLRHLRRLQLTGHTGGWLVGDGGLLMQTPDGGVSWQQPVHRPPPGLPSQFDFRALATRGESCWIAGAPGSKVLHSADSGSSWQVFDTGQSLPLQGLFFLDDQRGWAVGALGTVLATRDGGRHWHRQRSGGTRVAMLGFFSEPRRAPWELLTLLSGNEGYLGVLEIIARRDVELPALAESPVDERARDAAVAVGGSFADTAWRFPVRQVGLKWDSPAILEGWNQTNDGRGVQLLEERLVRKIRQWRPEVIVTEAASPRGENPLAHLTNQLVLGAVQRAAEPTAYSDQLTLAGLQPWSVRKAFSTHSGPGPADVTINTSQLALRLGTSVAEHASYGRGLIEHEFQASPPTVGFQLLINRLPNGIGRGGIFQGLALPAGGEARRNSVAVRATNLEELKRLAEKRRNAEHLLSRTGFHPQGSVAWLSQVEDLTSGLSNASAGDILFQLAHRYQRQGQLPLAADAFEQLVRRFPDHRLFEPALIWLVQYYASGEIAWRLRSGTQVAGAQIVTQAVRQPDSEGVVQPANFEQPARFQAQGRSQAAGAPLRIAGRADRAIELGHLVERTRPSLYAEPALRFPLAVALRDKGYARDAGRFYHSLAASPDRASGWPACAQGELWLGHGERTPPKPLYSCVAVGEKPRLDGRLDDPVWKAAKALPLTSALHDDAAWPAAAHLCRDDEYLYLAVSCRKAAGVSYSPSDPPRPRDPDLSGRDRIDVFLDVDRDYATWYRLTIDHRGWVGEACADDASWNPQWFVAPSEDEGSWTVEAAIPWQQLVGESPRRRDAWVMGLQRQVPGVGLQSWTRPAASQPRPAAFGLLIFP